MKTIKINNKSISLSDKPYFIADIAANHDGDLNRAFRLIELAKEAGADAAKFQNFTAKKIVSKYGFENLKFKLSHQRSWKKSVYQVYEEASIDSNWTPKLKEKCESLGIEYMSTPYDYDSLESIVPYSNAIKIGSGDITWHSFIETVASKKMPVIISTGASDQKEVEIAYKVASKMNKDIVIMQCNTNYTGLDSNFDYINLNVLKSFSERFPDAILGLSDHTPGHSTVLGAIALGARVIEKHFTDDTNREGPDHSFSMDPMSWREMVDRSIELWRALGSEIKKVEENEVESNLIQRRGVYLTENVSREEVINLAKVEFLRPIDRNGISPYEFDKVNGKKINKQIDSGQQLLWSDLFE